MKQGKLEQYVGREQRALRYDAHFTDQTLICEN